MNTCSSRRDELDDVALGSAPGVELTVHLEGCAACGAALDRQRAILHRIDSGVRYLMSTEPKKLPTRRSWLKTSAVAALAAGIIILLGVRYEQTLQPRNAVAVVALSEWHSPTAALLKSYIGVHSLERRHKLGGKHAP